MTDLQAKYPHSAGITRLAYSPCGKYLFTTGANAFVRRFALGSNDEPDTIELETPAFSIATSASHFATAGQDGITRLFELEGSEPTSMLARAALPIRSIEFNPAGDSVAIAGDDSLLIASIEDAMSALKLPEHPNQVRHVSFSSNGDMLATSCLDGNVRVYVIRTGTPELVHTIDGVIPAISIADDDRSSALAWSPDGKHFALPTKTFDIAIFEADTWAQTSRLTDGHWNAVTDLQWSPNGRYIATTGRDDKVVLWDVSSRKAVKSLPGVAGVSQVRWHPHENSISFVTSNGRLYTTDAVGDDLPSPVGDMFELQRPKSASAPTAGSAAGDGSSGSSGSSQRRKLEGDDVEGGQSDDLFGDDHDDDDGLVVEPPRRNGHAAKRQRTAARAEVKSLCPGATPWVSGRRYLCMNPVGYVWTVLQDSEHNTITVCFYDQSLERNRHFRDSEKFDLASLTSQGCLFANSTTGRVSMRFHASSADNWEYTISDGDKVRAITLSDDVAVVCSAKGYVRVFTTYGSPIKVYRHARDPVVAVAAHEAAIFFVRETASGQLEYSVEEAVGREVLQRHSAVDLPPNTSLKSIFFSESGDPCIYDSKGTLSMLVHWRSLMQAQWVPLFDGEEHAKSVDRQESYWPVGLVDQDFLCIILRGNTQYPPVPMPVTNTLPLAVPGMTPLESAYIVQTTLFQQEQERAQYSGIEGEAEQRLEEFVVELDKLLLRQLQEACHENRINKGLRIVADLKRPESVEAAIKIAMHFRLSTLAERIQQFLESTLQVN